MLREDVLGYFMPGGIPVICSKASSAGTLGETTAIHEACHEHLTRTTATGQYGMCLRKLWHELDLKRPHDAPVVETLLDALVNASRLTQEGYATQAQFFVISLSAPLEFDACFKSLPKFYQSAFAAYISFGDSLRLPLSRKSLSIRESLCYALASAAMGTRIFDEFPEISRSDLPQFMLYLKTRVGFPDLRLKALVEKCLTDENSSAVKNLRVMAAAAHDEPEDSEVALSAATHAVFQLAESIGLPVDWDAFHEPKIQQRAERLARSMAVQFDVQLQGDVVARSVELTELQYAWSFEDIERIPAVPVAGVETLRLWLTEQAARRDTRFVAMIYPDGASDDVSRLNIAYLTMHNGSEHELIALKEIRELKQGCEREHIASICRDFKIPLVTLWELFQRLPSDDRALLASYVQSIALVVYDPSVDSLDNAAARILGQPYCINIMDYDDAGKVFVLSSSETPLRIIAVLPDLAAGMVMLELSNRGVQVSPLNEEAHETVFLAAWMATYGPLGELISLLLMR